MLSPRLQSSTLLLGAKGDNVATMLLTFNIVVPDSIKADLISNAITVSSARSSTI